MSFRKGLRGIQPSELAARIKRGKERSQDAMRILWLVSFYCDHPAGLFFKQQAEAISRTGVVLSVVAPTPRVPRILADLSPHYAFYREQAREEVINEILVRRPRYFAHPREVFYGFPHLFIAASVRKLKLPKPDLIHAHYSYPCGLAAKLLARQWGINYIVTFHGSDVNQLPYHNRFLLKRFISVVRDAAGLVAVSRPLAEKVQELTGIRPLHVPIGVDLSTFEKIPDKQRAREILGLPKNLFIVLFVGNLLLEKGVDQLIRVSAQLDVDQYLILLIGEGKLQKDCVKATRIRYMGLKPNPEVRLFMRAADLLVLPSLSEGMPMVLVEAAALHCPIAATPVGGIKDFLAEDRGKFITVGDENSLKSCIEETRADYPSAVQSSQKLADYIQKNFDINANARIISDFYRQIHEKSH